MAPPPDLQRDKTVVSPVIGLTRGVAVQVVKQPMRLW
jgi:hypothetical protein